MKLLTIHVKNKQTKKVSEAVANVSYLFLRRRGKTKKREQERKGKSKRSQTERRNRATAGAAGSENFSGRTWISNGCSKVLVPATICFHRHIRGTEKTGGSAGPLVWVEGTAEIENSHKLQRGEQNWAKKRI